ncbi:macrophage mannose receptor 1-like [Acipenser ruthenus]|uniref:macrophage mannose receptor 1-like n=1 Tax=Acipenser ruthenus TaxID=7906 RepID=UPI00274184F5|nr:macrophage mannose receptor 1-like [Acipenser ruthenus]
MEKLVLLMLLLAGICEVASDHFRKYHFVKDEKSWFDAQSYCREKHTDLATIESQEETEKVLNISAGFTDAWIGLYYDKENWQWSNGDNVSYYNWKFNLSCTSVNSDGEWVDSHYTRESYILIDQPKTWYEAQKYCRTNYTDLVSIKNNDEDKKIKEKANGTAVWIGLFNNPWKWSHKGEYSSFHNWNKGEPNNVGNNICVEMYGAADKERESCKEASCPKYHFEKTVMNWSAAQTHCRDKYTDLATVHSQEEAKQLLDILNMSTNAWIGMYRDVSENWQWSNGDEVTYNTRRAKLFCATVSQDGDWTDSVCHDTKHFMCYNSSKETSERYILIEQPKTWYEAQQYCRDNYTDLVSVKNEDENKKIKEKANGNPVWIGLFNNPWKWSDGGDNYTPQNWSENQSDNYEGKEKCVTIQNKTNKLTLNDNPCSTAHPFFCYDDGKKLFLVKESKTWEEAVEYCRANYTDLVSIESEEKLQRVYREANKASSSHVWLGLLQSCTFGFWYWVDGTQSCYDNWAPEPRCQSGCNQCGVMTVKNGLKWTEKPCTERFNFICYNDTTGSSH